MYNKNRKAFTLVELAVVIAIIGFIMISLIVSKKLIFKSKIDGIISDIKKINNAVDQFETKYGSIPGDLAIADQKLTNATSSNNGNGNGIIDSTTEALQFWYHLKLAGLLSYNFDGTSSYLPATYTNSGGIMSGSIDNSAYNILSYDDTSKNYDNLISNAQNIGVGRIIVNLSFSPSSNYTTSLLTPQDALYIDKKLDDGLPNTGIIRSADGSDVTSGSCIYNNNYNSTTTTPACYMQIIIGNQKKTADYTSNICSNGPFGSNTYQQPCPEGYTGYISQSCGKDGNLITTENLCEAIRCSDGKSYGETITISCPNDSVGSMTLTCGAGGVYQISDMSACNNSTSTQCYGTISPAAYNTCPVGFGGNLRYPTSWTISCPGSASSKTCSPIICNTPSGTLVNIGYTTSSSDNSCPANYTYNNPNVLNTDYSYVCILSTSGTNGIIRPYKSYCIPNFGACSSIGSTRTLSCPKTQTGSNIQICNNSGYWETQNNSCTQVTCGGEPIGSYRIAQGQTCPIGTSSKGVMIEICDYTDLVNYTSAAWQSSAINCQ